ncbi:MAG: hypothetical protein AAB573_05455 [Patescibacteria group bacterium]
MEQEKNKMPRVLTLMEHARVAMVSAEQKLVTLFTGKKPLISARVVVITQNVKREMRGVKKAYNTLIKKAQEQQQERQGKQ